MVYIQVFYLEGIKDLSKFKTQNYIYIYILHIFIFYIHIHMLYSSRDRCLFRQIICIHIYMYVYIYIHTYIHIYRLIYNYVYILIYTWDVFYVVLAIALYIPRTRVYWQRMILKGGVNLPVKLPKCWLINSGKRVFHSTLTLLGKHKYKPHDEAGFTQSME